MPDTQMGSFFKDHSFFFFFNSKALIYINLHNESFILFTFTYEYIVIFSIYLFPQERAYFKEKISSSLSTRGVGTAAGGKLYSWTAFTLVTRLVTPAGNSLAAVLFCFISC